MSMLLHSWLNTPFKRSVAKLAALAVYVLLFRITSGSQWQPVVLALIPAAFALMLMRRSWRYWVTMRRQLLQWEVRTVRSWYAAASRGPFVRLLHVFGFASAVGAIALTVGGAPNFAHTIMNAVLFVFAMAGLCDVLALSSQIVKRTWARAMGKVLALTVSVALAAVSLSLAKNVTHSVAHIDPKYLSEFTVVLTSFFLPLVYVTAVSTALLVYGLIQICMMGIVMTVTSLFTAIPPELGRGRRNAARLFWYRLRHGKCPPGRIVAPTGFMPDEDIMLVTAPLSKIALGVVLWSAIHLIMQGLPLLTPALLNLIVSIEYRSNSSCTNIDMHLPVVYMEDGYVSVARRSSSGFDFEVVKCEFDRRQSP